MASLSFLLCLVLINTVGLILCVEQFNRDDFPPHFVFGSGSSAYQEDIQLMVETGLEAYRFSISWSRLIPRIQPHVTLVHDDLPQALEDEYGGWLSRNVVKDFTVYADVCFRNFGDRVLHWTTFNEVNIFALAGYYFGLTPPQRCSPPFGTNCSNGNSSSEPYIAAHNILLAHASAANLYKNKYQGRQQGFIGINIYTYWIINPVVFGDYPEIMKKNAGIRIPAFTELESKQVKGSFDFIGVNHYGTYYVKDDTNSLKMDNRDVMADLAIQTILVEQGDTPPGELPITPSGLVGLLEYFQQFYGNPPIYIHENGQRTYRNTTLQDIGRVRHMHGYIGGLLDAVRTRSHGIWLINLQKPVNEET
ncbi:beta glucosidase 11 [Actinidia rufa]|uniref:Beta glucosidase 11 n=1 Tax=Actinidia rufa TaxID=165716 RepID=A0A7J0GSQ0_9ERIC|nr:beta glucosidase 11 [Actinidia rufa]